MFSLLLPSLFSLPLSATQIPRAEVQFHPPCSVKLPKSYLKTTSRLTQFHYHIIQRSSPQDREKQEAEFPAIKLNLRNEGRRECSAEWTSIRKLFIRWPGEGNSSLFATELSVPKQRYPLGGLSLPSSCSQAQAGDLSSQVLSVPPAISCIQEGNLAHCHRVMLFTCGSWEH